MDSIDVSTLTQLIGNQGFPIVISLILLRTFLGSFNKRLDSLDKRLTQLNKTMLQLSKALESKSDYRSVVVENNRIESADTDKG